MSTRTTPSVGRSKLPSKPCEACGQPIASARLAALPGIQTCVACAAKNPVAIDPRKFDLSEASPINRNGFAPKD